METYTYRRQLRVTARAAQVNVPNIILLNNNQRMIFINDEIAIRYTDVL